MILFVLIISAFLLTATLILIFRLATTNASKLLDIPNERSSHSAPVTRGAGLTIVVTVIALYSAVAGDSRNLGFIVGGSAIAVISFLDDLFSLPLFLRLAVHISAAVLFVTHSASYNGFALPFSDSSIRFGELGAVLTVVFIVWVINAFNFMDGIDGIAGAQGAGSGFGWMLLGIASGIGSYSTLGAIILGSCLGFLVFNWQPAKVFMGDVGSTFLGFTFAVFPLMDPAGVSLLGDSGIAYASAFLWLFLFDSIFTRFGQVVRLKRFWRPHRDHIYQRLVAAGYSHSRVAAYFGSFALLIAVSVYLLKDLSRWPLLFLLFVGPSLLLLWKKWSASV